IAVWPNKPAARASTSGEEPPTNRGMREREREHAERERRDEELGRARIGQCRAEGGEREGAYGRAEHERHHEGREPNRGEARPPMERREDAQRMRRREPDHHGAEAIDASLAQLEPLAEARTQPLPSEPSREPELEAARHHARAGAESRAERGTEAEPARGKQQP